ncbi:hypothetical protein PENTCL1PPCAC_10519, partial [Pristionchus entomophagus]
YTNNEDNFENVSNFLSVSRGDTNDNFVSTVPDSDMHFYPPVIERSIASRRSSIVSCNSGNVSSKQADIQIRIRRDSAKS